MKLLVIVPWYEPAWGAGGTATAVSGLNRELVKLGVEITVLTTNDAGGGKFLDLDMNREYDYGGVKVYYYPCNFFIKSKKAFYSSELVKKIRREVSKHDLIHIHGTRHAFSFITAYYAKKNNIKYIITPHASLMQWWIDVIGNPFVKKLYMKFIESYTISNSSALHFLTLEEKIQSKNYIYGANSFIVSNGVEVNDYKRNLEVRSKLREKYDVADKNVLLFLGRIHPQKNLHIVIEAMAKLKNTVFFIVGPVGDKKYNNMILNIINQKKLNDVVFFIPPVTKEEVKYWYWTADYFISPSVVEGVSMSIIESLASSLPVIVSKNVANYREIEKDKCGLLVETKVDSMINLLVKIENSKTKNEFYTNNSEISANKRYDIRIVAKQIKENYNRILNE
jgi:glycosyltransferase involved in cell wall biosynthesis